MIPVPPNRGHMMIVLQNHELFREPEEWEIVRELPRQPIDEEHCCFLVAMRNRELVRPTRAPILNDKIEVVIFFLVLEVFCVDRACFAKMIQKSIGCAVVVHVHTRELLVPGVRGEHAV